MLRGVLTRCGRRSARGCVTRDREHRSALGMARVRRPVGRRGRPVGARAARSASVRATRSTWSPSIARPRSKLATGSSTSSASSASATAGSSSGGRSSRRRSHCRGQTCTRCSTRSAHPRARSTATRIRSIELIAEVVAPRTDLLAVKVHKRRAHYTVSGCMVERSELRTDHGDTRTICLESEDPARVIDALRGARAALASQCERAARAQGDGRDRCAALRRDRRRHELGQVPDRGARCGWFVAVDRGPCRGHATWRGPPCDRAARRRRDRTDHGGGHRNDHGGWPRARRGDRGHRDGRIADRPQPLRPHRCRARADGGRSRGDHR